jgi:hypothetical protein
VFLLEQDPFFSLGRWLSVYGVWACMCIWGLVCGVLLPGCWGLLLTQFEARHPPSVVLLRGGTFKSHEGVPVLKSLKVFRMCTVSSKSLLPAVIAVLTAKTVTASYAVAQSGCYLSVKRANNGWPQALVYDCYSPESITAQQPGCNVPLCVLSSCRECHHGVSGCWQCWGCQHAAVECSTCFAWLHAFCVLSESGPVHNSIAASCKTLLKCQPVHSQAKCNGCNTSQPATCVS